jgi:hypothetical protein
MKRKHPVVAVLYNHRQIFCLVWEYVKKLSLPLCFSVS